VIAQVIWTEISAQDGDIAVEDQIKLVERAVVAQDVEEARIAAFRIAHPTHEQQVDSIWYTEKELRGRGNPRKLTFNNLEKVVTAIWKRLHEIDGVRLSKGRVRQILMFRQLMWVERGRKGDVRDIRADQWKARLEREDILWATEHIRKNSPDNPTVSLVIDLLELEEMIGPEVEPKFEKRVEEVLAEESGSSFKGRTRLSKEGALLMPSAKKQVEITLSVERAAIKKNKVGPGNKAEPKRKVIASIIKEQYGASISPFKILQILKIRDGLVGVKDGLESHTIDIDIEEAARLLEKRYVRLARRKFLQFSRNPSARGVFSWLHNRYYIDRHNTTLTEETIYPLLHTIPTLSFYERVDVTLSAAERVDRERLAEGTSEEAKFEAMRKLLSEGSYPLTRPNDPLFSDEEMKRILDAREVLRGKSTGSSQTIELIDVVKKLREGETTESGRPKGLRPPPTGILPGQLQVFFDNPVVQARVDALMEFSVRLAKSNAGSVSRILVAEQLKNLFFMFADLNPKMLVEGITGLVNHPIYSVLGVEGFLAAEGGTKLLLNGMLNIQRFPRLLPFLHFVKAELPMAVAMTIMEVVGVALHTKHAVMLADQGTELERADFSTWLMIHAMLFAKTFKAAATDSKVLLHGGRKFLQFFAAAKFYTWGTFWTRAHWRTLFVRGKATRRAVYARTGQWGAIVADAAVVFTIEEVIDRAVDAYGTYKTEQAYRQQLVDARALYKEVILDPDATEEEKELADDVLDFSLSMSLLYLNQDLREGSHVEAIKQQQIHKRFDAEIAKIKEGEPNRFSATYDVGYAGKRIRSLEGRIEERYMLLGDGRYMINQQVVFEKPEEQGASSYWGSPSYTVSKPFRPEKSIVTAEELAIYQQERIAKMEAQRNMTIETMHVTMKTEAMQKAQPITERSKALIQEQIDWLIENIL
jgi:hypothetical protein